MILQALYDYRLRKGNILAPDGFEWRNIPLLIELSPAGQITGIQTSEVEHLVPQVPKRANTIDPALLWDNTEYVLGIPDQKKMASRDAGKYRSRVKAMHDAFRARIASLPEGARNDAGVKAVLAFYENDPVGQLPRFDQSATIRDKNPNLAFRLQGDTDLVCQRVASAAYSTKIEPDAISGLCLVTGEQTEIQRLHPSIKGIRDKPGSPSQKNIVSVNDGESPAFASYAKSQGYNSPVGKQSAVRYTTALNYLLRKGSPQKLQVADATTVFWADHDSSLENDFAAFFDDPRKDDPDPDRSTRAVAALLESARQGVGPVLDDRTRFFVLGLAPNAARIAIRFWQVGTVAEMATRIVRHFDDIKIDEPNEPPFLSLRLLLRSTAQPSQKWPGGDPEKVPPNLGGELIRAILEGSFYPETLFHGAVRRIRAEREITYPRAAILKACINRKRNPNEKEITVSLDFTNTNPGYRLGRLFAVLERVQEEANPRINVTIRDRYYGAFSAVPSSVFSTLMRLGKHHLATLTKLGKVGRRINLERLIGEIIDGLPPTLPSYLSLADQGRFAIGYYHQRMNPATYGKQGDPK